MLKSKRPALPKRLRNRNLALACHRGDFHERLLVIPGKNTTFMGFAEAGNLSHQ